MNSWKLTAPNALKLEEVPLPAETPDAIRVRISKVLLCKSDGAICAGKLHAKMPLVPGRYAVGIITEDCPHPLFPKGTRVLPHIRRAAPDTGTQKRDFSADEFEICGYSADGFLTDFVNISPDDMTPLPASVTDERALILHHVALAKALVDKLGAKKGQHVAVVGADMVGIFVCQLLIYQQAAPVLVDVSEERLAFARSCGVYYTMPADETVLDAVASVTGGRLASGAVYVAGAGDNDSSLPFLLTAKEGNVVLSGSRRTGVVVDLAPAFRKELTVHCVESGADYIETAINLVANRAVDLSAFKISTTGAETAASVLAGEFRADTLNVIKML